MALFQADDNNQGFSDIADLLMKNKINKEQMRQFNENLAITKSQNARAQSAENRQSQLFKYDLDNARLQNELNRTLNPLKAKEIQEKLKENEFKRKVQQEYYSKLFPNSNQESPSLYSNINQQNNNLPQKSKSMMNNLLQLQNFSESGQVSPEDQTIIKQFIGQQQGGEPYRPMPQAMDMPRKDLIRLANERSGYNGQQQPQMQSMQPQQQQQMQPHMQNQPEMYNPEKMQVGETFVKENGNPGLYEFDKLAGQKLMEGMPAIKNIEKGPVVNGMQKLVYPSGKIVYEKVGPTDQEKKNIESETAIKKDQEKLNNKKSEDLVDEGKILVKFANHVGEVDQILDKNKDKWGMYESGKKLIGLGSGYAGELSAHIAPMVGGLAKEMSRQGGAIVSKLASSSKPELKQSWEYNKKLNKQLAKDTYHGWKELKDNYERRNPGKEYPIKLPDYYDKVRVKDAKGATYIMTEEQAIKNKIDHPELEILGNIYE